MINAVELDFWAGRRVFLTGHTGFKGSWLSLWLQSLGASVKGYALPPPTHPALFYEARIVDGMESEFGDIRDYAHLEKTITSFDPEVLIHMAAQPLVRQSYADPVETYSTNVMGTVNVLEVSRKCPSLRSIVNVTTDKCYENREWVWGYREDEPLGGRDPYSSSKGCAELVTSAYRHSFFDSDSAPALASARAGNVIGGGDWAEDRLIPDVLNAFDDHKPASIRNPLATRPWQHVLEPLSGYLILAQKLFKQGQLFSGGWNFGPRDQDVKSVEAVLKEMVQILGHGASWKHDANYQPHEAQLLKLDISKAEALLGWRPQWSLEHALNLIIDWHNHWKANGDTREKTLEQIFQKVTI